MNHALIGPKAIIKPAPSHESKYRWMGTDNLAELLPLESLEPSHSTAHCDTLGEKNN